MIANGRWSLFESKKTIKASLYNLQSMGLYDCSRSIVSDVGDLDRKKLTGDAYAEAHLNRSKRSDLRRG